MEDLTIIQIFGFAFPQFQIQGTRLKKYSLSFSSLRKKSSARLYLRSRSWQKVRFLSAVCFYLQHQMEEVFDTIHKEKVRFVVGNMASSLSARLHVILMSAEFITGITVNGFLIIINCNELVKSRKLTAMHLLFICIGMSRFGLQIVLMVKFFSRSFHSFIE